MSEFDPDAHIILAYSDGVERRLDRFNSALYTFIGKTALGEDNSARDHVYHRFENDGERQGTYIFRNSDAFATIAQYMMENEFTLHLNMTEVAECDENAYQMMIDKEVKNQQVPDEIPEDWLTDGA